MESLGLENIISKFLLLLQEVVKNDERFDFDEDQVILVRETAGEEVVRAFNRASQDFILIKRITLGSSHVTANIEALKGVNSASCPNLASIIGTIKADDGSFWIFIDDGPESEKLSYLIENRGTQGNNFTEGELAHIALDMALGLAHLQLLGLSQRNVRPRAFFYQENKYLLTDIALTPGGLDKTAMMFGSPNTIQSPVHGFKVFREDSHALGRILLLMMLVGGTEKVIQEFDQAHVSTGQNEKHPWDKSNTHWKMLVVPYEHFSHFPTVQNFQKYIVPLFQEVRQCGRYSSALVRLIENLVAYEPDTRLDFFSIVRFLSSYRRWNEAEVSDFFQEEIALSQSRAEGTVETLKEQNELQGYLRLAQFSNEDQIEAKKEEIVKIIEEIETEVTEKQAKHSEVDDFCLSLSVDEEKPNLLEITLGDDQFYRGELNEAGDPHGIGQLTKNMGTYVYIGEWVSGKRKGRGKVTDGNYVYMGFFEDDKRHGWGMEDFVGDSEWAGDRFQGDFENDKRNGVGLYTYDNGDSYLGRYKDNTKEGIGRRIEIGRFEYKGEFKDGKLEGWGILKLEENGDVYEGQFKNDQRHGFGCYLYGDGDRYLGQYFDGKQEGKGRFEQPEEGFEYEGDWYQDDVEGWGVQKWEDGEKYDGEFQTDERHGYGRWINSQQVTYEGFYAKGMKEGYGELKKPNGYVYRGSWVQDKKTGAGFEERPSGDTYEGNFLDDRHEGFGIEKVVQTGEVYRGNFFSNIRMGKGHFTLPDGYVYDGMWEKNEATGFGKELLPSGEKYEGEFINMKRDGKGKCTFVNGEVYEGDWDNGVQHGKGKLTRQDGYSYNGDWVQGEMTGKGFEVNVNSETYEGDFVIGVRHGKGKYSYINGEVYEGDFSQGQREGKGILSDGKGYSYQGDWKVDKANGKGLQKWADGDYYEGDFVDDLREGLGNYFFNNGSYYKGEWKEGAKHGKGKLEIVDYYVYEGEWRDDMKHGTGEQYWVGKCKWAGDKYNGDYVEGKRQGYGVYKYVNGDVYEGSWVNGMREGKGSLKQKGGYEYEGEWKHDQEHGYGTQRWTGNDEEWKGDQYEGEMRDGFREGRGVYRYSNGDEYSGEWVGGRRQGNGKLWCPTQKTLYEGEWQFGSKNGDGVLRVFKDEDREQRPEEEFKGTFKNDQMDGEGVYVYADGSKYEGTWEKNKRNGLGKQYDGEGNILHDGVWEDDTFMGKVSKWSLTDLASERLQYLLKQDTDRLHKPIEHRQSGSVTPTSQRGLRVKSKKRDESSLILEAEEDEAPKSLLSTMFCGCGSRK